MNYKNRQKYEGMSIDELCDAIADASKVMDGDDLNGAVKLLVEDLRDALLDTDQLFVLRSKYTNSPYITERLSAMVFEDEYYANKFADERKELGLIVDAIKNEAYENFFSVLHDCGVNHIDLCGEGNNYIRMLVDELFLSDDYNKKNYSAIDLNRFSTMLMQEVRNTERVYDRKDNIVTLLKKNVIATLMGCAVWVPVAMMSVDGKDAMKVLTAPVNVSQATFPVYTNLREAFAMRNHSESIKLTLMKAPSVIRFVSETMKQNKSIVGLTINPLTTNFTMTGEVLDICLENFRENHIE